MFNRIRQVLLVSPLVFLAACATITTGTDHTILVESEPAGATCILQRNDSNIGAVNPTPGSVRISKSRHDLLVRCERADYQATSRLVTASFQAMTAGNILIGGVVGLAADLASGAAVTYPDSIKVVLWPASFPSADERTAFYEARRAEARADFQQRYDKARGACGGRMDQNCQQRLTELQTAYRDELRLLIERRRRTPIKS
ncbi:MAG: hypothetical protein INF90_15865 [Roseomonas sp.]|jgi:hypothetical protein|nr:hypothetical protein [Roseomonas sp.]MCA3368018.1 hypothetical protein [Roseomonas sp.]